jgi:hypothetical protein
MDNAEHVASTPVTVILVRLRALRQPLHPIWLRPTQCIEKKRPTNHPSDAVLQKLAEFVPHAWEGLDEAGYSLVLASHIAIWKR